MKEKPASEKDDSIDQRDSDREKLQREYEILIITLNNLKRKAVKLRGENEFLQNENNRIETENQEYISYLSKRTEKCQDGIKTLSDQNHKDLEALMRQRQETQAKYEEQANELRKLIEQKDSELAVLKKEIPQQLTVFKSLQQQHVDQIAALEKEITNMHYRHSEHLHALSARFHAERESFETQVKPRAQSQILATSREATQYLQSYTRQVLEDNQRLRGELQHLILKASALKARQGRLTAQMQKLCLEKQYETTLKTPFNHGTQPKNTAKRFHVK